MRFWQNGQRAVSRVLQREKIMTQGRAAGQPLRGKGAKRRESVVDTKTALHGLIGRDQTGEINGVAEAGRPPAQKVRDVTRALRLAVDRLRPLTQNGREARRFDGIGGSVMKVNGFGGHLVSLTRAGPDGVVTRSTAIQALVEHRAPTATATDTAQTKEACSMGTRFYWSWPVRRYFAAGAGASGIGATGAAGVAGALSADTCVAWSSGYVLTILAPSNGLNAP